MGKHSRRTSPAGKAAGIGAALGVTAALATSALIPATATATATATAAPTETKSGPRVVLHHSPVARGDQADRINTALAEAVERHTAWMAAIERAAREHATVAPTTGVFTSGFGPRWGTMHNGIDIAAPVYTPIYAVRSGVIEEAGPAQGYGQWVVVRHDDGARSIYGHVETITAWAGQRVVAGDQIAGMGNRGFSTGPHLHFEYHPDGYTPIDPLAWLRANGVTDW